jgi:hypothetical protein
MNGLRIRWFGAVMASACLWTLPLTVTHPARPVEKPVRGRSAARRARVERPAPASRTAITKGKLHRAPKGGWMQAQVLWSD